MLYLCMVLIGRRHWMGGRDGRSLLGHYLVRFVCLVGGGGVARYGRRVARFPLRRDGRARQLAVARHGRAAAQTWTRKIGRSGSTPTSAPTCRKTTCKRGSICSTICASSKSSAAGGFRSQWSTPSRPPKKPPAPSSNSASARKPSAAPAEGRRKTNRFSWARRSRAACRKWSCRFSIAARRSNTS